jgi:hypothetical protein
MAGLFMAWIAFAASRNPAMAPPGERLPVAAVLLGLVRVLPLVCSSLRCLAAFFWASPRHRGGRGWGRGRNLARLCYGRAHAPKILEALAATARTFAIIGVVFHGRSRVRAGAPTPRCAADAAAEHRGARLSKYVVLALVILSI